MDSSRRQNRPSRNVKTVDLTVSPQPSSQNLPLMTSSAPSNSSRPRYGQPQLPAPIQRAGSSSTQPAPTNVIDLTGDDSSPPPGPRYGRRSQTPAIIRIPDEVVDLDALPDSASDQNRRAMRDVFVSSRHERHLPIPVSVQASTTPHHHHHHHHHHHPPRPDYRFPGAGSLMNVAAVRPPPRGPLASMGRFIGSPLPPGLTAWFDPLRDRASGLHADLHTVHMDLDYSSTSFRLGPDSPSTAPVNYSPPSPPQVGFTRSPEESEVVVCPNCDQELAVGDTKEQKAVYVVKKCGHAYCGTCALRRKKTPSKSSGKGGRKGAAAAPLPPLPPGAQWKPFGKCVVENCGVSTSAQASMIQVYL